MHVGCAEQSTAMAVWRCPRRSEIASLRAQGQARVSVLVGTGHHTRTNKSTLPLAVEEFLKVLPAVRVSGEGKAPLAACLGLRPGCRRARHCPFPSPPKVVCLVTYPLMLPLTCLHCALCRLCLLMRGVQGEDDPLFGGTARAARAAASQIAGISSRHACVARLNMCVRF